MLYLFNQQHKMKRLLNLMFIVISCFSYAEDSYQDTPVMQYYLTLMTDKRIKTGCFWGLSVGLTYVAISEQLTNEEIIDLHRLHARIAYYVAIPLLTAIGGCSCGYLWMNLESYRRYYLYSMIFQIRRDF